MESLTNLIKALKDLIDVFYERFFLRDFLGKVLPGFILLLTIVIFYFFCNTKTITPTQILDRLSVIQVEASSSFTFLYWIGLIGVSYVFGFCVQRAGEFLGIHCAHPKLFLKFYKWKRGEDAREMFFERMVFFKSDKRITIEQKSQRERYAVIKEMTGNMALSFFLLGLTLFYEAVLYWQYALFLIIVSILAYSAHCVHRIRQKDYEETTMRKMGIIAKDDTGIELLEEMKHYKKAKQEEHIVFNASLYSYRE